MTDQNPNHSLTLDNRKKLTLTGITEVVTFDEEAVLMHTPLGDLTVLGQQLQLKELTPQGGSVSIQGQISAISYDEPRDTHGWLGRFFR